MTFMSSPRPAAARPARTAKSAVHSATPSPAKSVRPAAKPAQPPPATRADNPADGSQSSAEAKRLATEIERALASGRPHTLSADALQALMAAVCKTYAARVEGGEALLPLPERGGATATEVMITASGLLKSANLAVFELGMWQSWTGR
jgi:hypothetical protein